MTVPYDTEIFDISREAVITREASRRAYVFLSNPSYEQAVATRMNEIIVTLTTPKPKGFLARIFGLGRK